MKNWIPSISLSLMAFIFVTTEFIPVGLLPDIAEGVGKTTESTGLLMTVYAWIVATMSLPLTILSSKFDRRKLVITLLSIFIVAHFLAGLAQSFNELVFARVMIALTHAVFWSITTPLAIRLAPIGKKNIALAIIFTGASLGNVLGIPIGTILGHAFGWQQAFIAIGVFSLVIFCVIYKVLPPTKSSYVATFSSVPLLLKNKTLLLVYFLTVVVITGHFTLFTYISPIFQEIGIFSSKDVAILLLVFGLSGIIGNYIAGKLVDKMESKLISIGLIFILSSLLLLVPLLGMTFLSYVNLAFWGIALSLATFVFQAKVIHEAREASDIAVSMYSGIFNIGIGGGAFIGSLATPRIGLNNLGNLGAIFLVLAVIVFLFHIVRSRYKLQ